MCIAAGDRKGAEVRSQVHRRGKEKHEDKERYVKKTKGNKVKQNLDVKPTKAKEINALSI